MIEPIREEPEVKELDSNHKGVKTDEDIEAITHTVHALAGYANPQTMKIGRTLKHKSVTILIDIGSTNNFMDRKVAARLTHYIEGCDKFEVKIIDEWILTCDSKCSKIKLIIQGPEFLAMINTLKCRLIAYIIKKWRPYLLDQQVVMRYRQPMTEVLKEKLPEFDTAQP